MKRETVIKQIKDVLHELYGENTGVYTNLGIYPKCFACITTEKGTVTRRLSYNMRPTELLAYVNGMKFSINNEF